MASGALQQLLTQTNWGELDFLIVDMPPGTGDIQLTLAQKVPLAGAVVVTTPQDIALLDARKGIEMFRRVAVPVIGIVENMSIHVCSNCRHEEAIFGEGGGKAVAADYETELLGQLPLTLKLREQSDVGMPIVISDPDAVTSVTIREVAGKVQAFVEKNVTEAPVINIFND
jgi:ATP-binding protein involved in chromosome partitioning